MDSEAMTGSVDGADVGGMSDDWSLDELSTPASDTKGNYVLRSEKIVDGDGDCDGKEYIVVKGLCSQN